MRFVFISPFRNCAPFLKECAESLLKQKRGDWVAFFRDDCSDDEGANLIPSDPRIFVQRNSSRLGGLGSVHEGIVSNNLSNEDIVCVLDGDDYLVGDDVLDVISSIYEEKGCLVSYGQYENNNGDSGHCRAYSREDFGRIRSCGFIASHLKTFRYKVYAEAMRRDPNCDRYRNDDGAFFDMAWDIALMTPLMELVGFEGVAFNPKVVYHYRTHAGNECSVNSTRQRDFAKKAFAKDPMPRVF